jgi:hypothetical protein|tara:strand:- start:601 stop:837 length:237 start_codon:yes stop_codon:yes gene_type:complete
MKVLNEIGIVSNSGFSMIERAIQDRLKAHEKEHEGLYSESDLKTLRPIWFKQIQGEISMIGTPKGIDATWKQVVTKEG